MTLRERETERETERHVSIQCSPESMPNSLGSCLMDIWWNDGTRLPAILEAPCSGYRGSTISCLNPRGGCGITGSDIWRWYCGRLSRGKWLVLCGGYEVTEWASGCGKARHGSDSCLWNLEMRRVQRKREWTFNPWDKHSWSFWVNVESLVG